MNTTADKIEALYNTKNAIKEAITNKGVTGVTDVFATYPQKILEIIDYGEATVDLDWSAVGYSHRPTDITKGYEYAIQILNEFQDKDNLTGRYAQDDKLIFFPNLIINAKIITNMFTEDYYLEYLDELNCPNATELSNLFSFCQNLQQVNSIDAPNAYNVSHLFHQCKNLKKIGTLNTPSAQLWNGAFVSCDSLQKIGSVDVSSATNFDDAFDSSKMPNLRYMSIKNLGKKDNNPSSSETLDFLNLSNWGIDNGDVTGCKQSVIDSLLTNSFDRKLAGYSPCYLKLSANTKSCLTSMQINELNQKGFFIS